MKLDGVPVHFQSSEPVKNHEFPQQARNAQAVTLASNSTLQQLLKMFQSYTSVLVLSTNSNTMVLCVQKRETKNVSIQ